MALNVTSDTTCATIHYFIPRLVSILSASPLSLPPGVKVAPVLTHIWAFLERRYLYAARNKLTRRIPAYRNYVLTL